MKNSSDEPGDESDDDTGLTRGGDAMRATGQSATRKRRRAEAAAAAGPVYNANTINNYFFNAPPEAVAVAAAAAAAASAPSTSGAPAAEAAPAPPSIFTTNAERRHNVTVKKGGKDVSVYVSDACRDGTLRGGCHHTCSNQWVSIARFAPEADSTNSAGHHQTFDAAYAAYQAAFAAGDRDEAIAQRAVVEALRTTCCDACRESMGTLSLAQQACKDEWKRMKQEACARQDGCRNQQCSERGMASWPVLQADHGTNAKVFKLSDYKFWSGNGGVGAMRAEAQNIHQWVCGVCHSGEETSASGRRHGDPALMPDGKRSGTTEEKKQYYAKRSAKMTFPKYEHVDAAKRRIGRCQYPGCSRPVLPGTEPGFHWDHREEGTKCKGGLYGAKGGVAGLAANNAKASALDEVRELLDEEMAKCDLLCMPCHYSRKQKGRERWDDAV